MLLVYPKFMMDPITVQKVLREDALKDTGDPAVYFLIFLAMCHVGFQSPTRDRASALHWKLLRLNHWKGQSPHLTVWKQTLKF